MKTDESSGGVKEQFADAIDSNTKINVSSESMAITGMDVHEVEWLLNKVLEGRRACAFLGMQGIEMQHEPNGLRLVDVDSGLAFASLVHGGAGLDVCEDWDGE